MNMPERFWDGTIKDEVIKKIRAEVLKFSGRRGRILWVKDEPPADIVWEGVINDDQDTLDAIADGVLKHINEKGTMSWIDAR